MRLLGIITTILLGLGSYFVSFSQDYNAYIRLAEKQYLQKEYSLSTENYTKAFQLMKAKGDDYYNGACSASLSGDIALSFKWLYMALDNNWTNVEHLKTDSDLIPLRTENEWNSLVEEMNERNVKKEANINKSLQAELIEIYNSDQGIRQQYVLAQQKFGADSKEVDSLGRIMAFRDSINLLKVITIVDHYGWVSPVKVGGQASYALFLVIQHADLTAQKKYFPQIKAASERGEINKSSVAILEDKIAVGEGSDQIYGSQIGYDKEDRRYFVLPLKDPKNVDQRRASVGLGTLAEYVVKWDITWDVGAYIKWRSEKNSPK